MARNNGDSKDNLLEELESIKGLLQEAEDDIPVLREVIESFEPVDEEAARQTSLFTNPAQTAPTLSARQRVPVPPKASGENPFLPAHIRARLQGNRPPPPFEREALSGAGPEEDAAGATAQLTSSDSREQLIDELMRELQPELEARLREKLKTLSPEQLRRLVGLEAETP